MKYTVNELAEEINRSRPVTIKWAERKGFKATTKVVKNREIKAYELTNTDLEDLKHALDDESMNEVTTESDLNPTSNRENQVIRQENHFDKLLEFTSQYIADMKQSSQLIQSMSERASYAEGQLKLIETSEARKDARIRELESTVKQLETQLKELQGNVKKWWKF